MRLTTRGWTLAAAAVGLYAGSRALGTVELAMLAAGAATALALAALFAVRGRADIRARRTLHPPRLHAGVTARAEIELNNRGPRATPILAVTDTFTGRREARFGVPPVPPGESARGGFRLPTGRRGVYEVGPLQVSVTDPLGLVRRPVATADAQPVTVFPRIESVRSLPLTVGRDLVGGSVADFARSRSGDEFHGLREYAIGDDLRRVHWRSTARLGELMIKEHDIPWQTRATLLIDDRRALHSAASFERLVEAAASMATALHAQGSIMRLVSSAGGETRFGVGHDHYGALMERLAVMARTDDERFERMVAHLHRQKGSGALVAFTGAASGADLTLLGALRRRFGFVAVVRFDVPAGASDATSDAASGATPGVTLVDVTPNESFADAWHAALTRRFRTRRSSGARR